jgi:Arc/MetJ-type ribon-helix-helix transcriptional regulator
VALPVPGVRASCVGFLDPRAPAADSACLDDSGLITAKSSGDRFAWRVDQSRELLNGKAAATTMYTQPYDHSCRRQDRRIHDSGMVNGMATTKITITLPDRQLEEIRKRVAAQESASVSGFIQQAVQKSLENAAEFRAMVNEVLNKTGGPLTPKERAWARRVLSQRKRGGRPRKAA